MTVDFHDWPETAFGEASAPLGRRANRNSGQPLLPIMNINGRFSGGVTGRGSQCRFAILGKRCATTADSRNTVIYFDHDHTSRWIWEIVRPSPCVFTYARNLHIRAFSCSDDVLGVRRVLR